MSSMRLGRGNNASALLFLTREQVGCASTRGILVSALAARFRGKQF